MEGLFRNGANPSYQENMVSVNILTEQIFGEEKRNAIYTKLIFFLKNTESADLIQVVYHNKNMDISSIIRVSHLKNLPVQIRRDGRKDRMLLFSLFEMFFLNSSGSVSFLIKKIDPSFVKNNEILNTKSVSLYRKYRNYLRQGDKKDMNLGFDFEAEKKKMGSFYQKSRFVKLVKIAEHFFWKVELQSLKAFFTNGKHQLRDLKLNFFGEKFNISTDYFVIFSNIYELPKTILFENEARERFSFKILKFKVFNGSSRYMDKKAKEYMDYEEKFRKNKFKIKSLLKDSLKFYY